MGIRKHRQNISGVLLLRDAVQELSSALNIESLTHTFFVLFFSGYAIRTPGKYAHYFFFLGSLMYTGINTRPRYRTQGIE